mmetsp:Transcript_7832/g.19207  ORF Transcript_7832/g.19207 Transcript_7832/m.19207 type:complete len:373 (-) Transcript_7832:1526-2644(-)
MEANSKHILMRVVPYVDIFVAEHNPNVSLEGEGGCAGPPIHLKVDKRRTVYVLNFIEIFAVVRDNFICSISVLNRVSDLIVRVTAPVQVKSRRFVHPDHLQLNLRAQNADGGGDVIALPGQYLLVVLDIPDVARYGDCVLCLLHPNVIKEMKRLLSASKHLHVQQQAAYHCTSPSLSCFALYCQDMIHVLFQEGLGVDAKALNHLNGRDALLEHGEFGLPPREHTLHCKLPLHAHVIYHVEPGVSRVEEAYTILHFVAVDSVPSSIRMTHDNDPPRYVHQVQIKPLLLEALLVAVVVRQALRAEQVLCCLQPAADACQPTLVVAEFVAHLAVHLAALFSGALAGPSELPVWSPRVLHGRKDELHREVLRVYR